MTDEGEYDEQYDERYDERLHVATHATSLDGMTDDLNSGAAYVMFPGTPGAHVMIPTDGYYEYQDPR